MHFVEIGSPTLILTLAALASVATTVKLLVHRCLTAASTALPAAPPLGSRQ
jgi:hypothetical protein